MSRKSSVQQQMEYLEENLGRMPLHTIAKRMGKSVRTLEMTLHRNLGTSNTKSHTGMVTAGELANALHIDRNTIICWINRHGLKAKRRITHTSKKFTFIDIQDFWEWCADHLDKVNLSLLEKNALPPEPGWVERERQQPKKVKKYKAWTIQEEEFLVEEINKGTSFQDIAKTLCRTPYSVEKKYSRIKQEANR